MSKANSRVSGKLSDAELASMEAADLAQRSVKGVKTLSDAEKHAKVAELIVELRLSVDADDKKSIRRKLRALGHTGGLRSIDKPAIVAQVVETPAIVTPSVTQPAKKAGKRANKALKQ